MVYFLAKAWLWIKSYWYIPLLLAVALGALLLKKKGVVDWDKVMVNARDSHKQELDAIENAHAAEIAARDAALRRMREARAQVEAEYERNKLEIDKKKQKEIDRVLKKTKEDPVAMAEELERVTGYKVFIIE